MVTFLDWARTNQPNFLRAWIYEFRELSQHPCQDKGDNIVEKPQQTTSFSD